MTSKLDQLVLHFEETIEGVEEESEEKARNLKSQLEIRDANFVVVVRKATTKSNHYSTPEPNIESKSKASLLKSLTSSN